MDLDESEMEWCRVCMDTSSAQLINWNTIVDGIAEIKTFQQCFTEIAQLDTVLQYPQTICFTCAAELRGSYMFIKKMRESERIRSEKLKNGAETPKGLEFELVDVGQDIPDNSNRSVFESISEDSGVALSSPLGAIAIKGLKSTKSRKRHFQIERTYISSLADQLQGCELCNNYYPREYIATHIELVHEKPRKQTYNFLCHICPRSFRTARLLKEHLPTHDEARVRKYSCDHCGRKFFTRHHLNDHMKTHEKNRKRIFPCETCAKAFFHKTSLALHKKLHSGETVQCKECQRHFLRPIDLQVHKRIHSGDRPFRCRHCRKSFKNISHLNRHMLQHLGYRFKCDICEKEYSEKSTLLQHRRQHTGLPLKCLICDTGFAKKKQVYCHLRKKHEIHAAENMEPFIVIVPIEKTYNPRTFLGYV